VPKVRREGLPKALLEHLLERVRLREFSLEQLELLLRWLETSPDVPQQPWYKRFPGVTVCGEGELVKTFLRPEQAPLGIQLN
jgi:hypothetical protein